MAFNWSKSGFKHAPAYMASGIPFVTSSENNKVGTPANPIHVSFPFVTRWICIRSLDNAANLRPLRIGFTENACKPDTSGSAFTIPDQNTPHNPGFGMTDPVLEIACTDIFISSDFPGRPTEMSLIAGLTTIPRSEYPNLTGSIDGIRNFDGVG